MERQLTVAQQDLLLERASILEFDAGLSRSEAEREARRLVLGERTQGALRLENAEKVADFGSEVKSEGATVDGTRAALDTPSHVPNR